ncbi:MAG: lipopolysaccharide biosynthesis protein [Bacteroidales bacterium]|jgi:O-antigen/teichoic acid export membrane protein|nr:lipopolysaccharide biosynthesis protein [Bacteroidales bacterium]
MEIKKQTFNGVFWSAVERFSVQGVQFLIQAILMRRLMPDAFGLIAILLVFIAISQSIIDSGFSNALIRKKDRTEEDFATAFYFNLILGVVLYLVLFFLAPIIANFYNDQRLIPLTRIISVVLLINSFTIVQRTQLIVKVDFKTQAKASLIAILFAGCISIFMAYRGFGVWSLVFQEICYRLINMVLLWVYSKWVPKRVFSIKSLREMFAFGSRLLVAGLLDTIYRQLYNLVIGKRFSKSELGFYSRADVISQFPSMNISNILGRVTFPILSHIQDDDKHLAHVYRKYLRLSAFVIFPLMMGLSALASPLVIFFFTEKWSGAIIFLQIICFAYMWFPIHAINLNLLQVKGRSDLFLRLEIIKKAVGVIILVITIPFGIKAMCYGLILNSIIALIVNTHYTGILINVGFFKQMKDLLPTLLYSLTMFIGVFFLIKLFDSNIVKILLGLSLGAIYYIFISYITKSEELKDIIQLIKKRGK